MGKSMSVKCELEKHWLVQGHLIYLLYNVTICLLSSMLEFRRLVPLTVFSLSRVGLIHIVVCRDARMLRCVFIVNKHY